MVGSRWTKALVVAAVIEIGLFVVEDWFRVAPSTGTWGAVLTAIGVVAHLVLAVAIVALVRLVLRERRTQHHERQVLSAMEGLSSDWLWEADVDLRVTYSSSGVERLLGYLPGDIVGTSMVDLLFDRGRADELRQEVTGPGALSPLSGNAEIEWKHREGHPVVLTGSAAALVGPDGRLVGHRGVRRWVGASPDFSDLTATMHRNVSSTIAQHAVDIALQPIVSLSTQRLTGVEALARFRDGRGPDVWFREARESGLTVALDRLCFEAALDRLAEVPPTAYLSVNASPDLLLDPSFPLVVPDRADLRRVVVEITEHHQVQDYDRLRAVLGPLRERGLRIAVDDTGAGYASMTHILRLRPDIIKLDRELLTDLELEPARRSLITALVLLALDLDADVTAEGVETATQLATLATLGADSAQGFLLARPSTLPDDWSAWETRRWIPGQRQQPVRSS